MSPLDGFRMSLDSGRTDSEVQDHIYLVEAVPGRAARQAEEALKLVTERMLAHKRAARGWA